MVNTHVCPWQTGHLLNVSARKLLHHPRRVLGPHIAEGMTVMDVGCGMGYFTIPMARMAGERGRVIAADLQPEMLDGMLRNAVEAGVEKRVEPRLCGQKSMNIGDLSGQIDFVILFMMLHEVPDRERLVWEVRDALKPGGRLLFAEPVVHVGKQSFERSLRMMRQTGFTVVKPLHVAICRAVLLEKGRG